MASQTKQNRRLRFIEDMKKKRTMDIEGIVKEHVLPHLPAKSLLRFQTVCKDWNQWINNPIFPHNQTLSFRAMSGLFRQSNGESPSFISLNPKSAYGVPDPSLEFLPVIVDIRSSCNGLLCCQGRNDDKPYFICNPFNKQWKKLPNPNYVQGIEQAIVLIFEPSLLNFSVDYKLICPFNSVEFPGSLEFEIYSSETRAWELSKEICYGQSQRSLSANSGFYFNGNVYWNSGSGKILSFDPINEHCKILNGSRDLLTGIDGKLCYVTALFPKINVYLCDLYSNTMPMACYRSAKSRSRHSFVLDSAVVGKNWKHCQALPSVGSDLLMVLVGEMIVSYHLYEKELTVLSASGNDREARYFPYVNSFVSVSSL